jgi:hypothetical protein
LGFDTAFFILEDDAQDGADHVDAHRSIGLVVSKYAPREAYGGVFVDSRFYSTVSVVRTMETLLGLPPMNNNDAFASLISPIFLGSGESAGVYGGYHEPRQRADLHGECEDSAGREGEREDGLQACGPRGCGEAERDFVAGRDGEQAGAGDAEGETEEDEGWR